MGDATVSSPPSPSGRNTVSASPVETNHVFPHQPSAEQYVPPLEHSHSYNAPSHDYAGHAIGLAPLNTDNTGSLDPQLSNSAGAHNNFPAINGAYGSSMMPPAAMPDRRFSFDASSVSVHVTGLNTFSTLLLRLQYWGAPQPPTLSSLVAFGGATLLLAWPGTAER